MTAFVRRHSFAVVACAAVVGGFGYFCANYVPLYHEYHVQRDIFTNETVFHGGGGGCLANTTADGVPRPCIGSPITFLVVNFVYSYAVLVIVVRLCGLYAWPMATTTSDPTTVPSERPCCGGYHVLGTVPEPAEPVAAEPVEPLVVWTADDYRPRVGSRVPVVRTSVVSSGRKSWDGDWNKYWNDKPDF